MRRRSILALGFAASVALTGIAFAQTDGSPNIDVDAGTLHPLDGVYRPDGADEASLDAKGAQASSCSFSPEQRRVSPSFFVLALPLLFLRRKRGNGTGKHGSA
jgi:hypothetical protein